MDAPNLPSPIKIDGKKASPAKHGAQDELDASTLPSKRAGDEAAAAVDGEK